MRWGFGAELMFASLSLYCLTGGLAFWVCSLQYYFNCIGVFSGRPLLSARLIYLFTFLNFIVLVDVMPLIFVIVVPYIQGVPKKLPCFICK